MKTIQEVIGDSRFPQHNAALPSEAWRVMLAGAVETLKEASLLHAAFPHGKGPAFPVEYLNAGPGALQSRVAALVDAAGAQYGMQGTGGTFDAVDYDMDDQPFLGIWANFEIPFREYLASQQGTAGLDLLRDTAANKAVLVAEKTNTAVISGLGPIKGLTNATGIQTFASAGAWTTAGIAWQDIAKALGKLWNAKVGYNNAALMVNPLDYVNLLQTFSNTDTAQLEKLTALLPGGVYYNTNVTQGKAYVYAKDPRVFRIRVAQDTTLVPLPAADENPRGRVRTFLTTHATRATGICEITSVDS